MNTELHIENLQLEIDRLKLDNKLIDIQKRRNALQTEMIKEQIDFIRQQDEDGLLDELLPNGEINMPNFKIANDDSIAIADPNGVLANDNAER